MEQDQKVNVCAFCREPPPTVPEGIKRLEKRMERGDGNAFFHIGIFYSAGSHGLPLDLKKAHEMYLRAGELGSAEAHFNLGHIYRLGNGAEVNLKTAKKYFVLAAKGGM